MKRWMIAALCACVCCFPVWAGIGKGNGEIGFDFGATGFDDDLTGKNGFLLALRGGYHFTRLFELEIEFSDSAHYDWSARTTEADLRLDSLFLNGVFNFPTSTGGLVP